MSEPAAVYRTIARRPRRRRTPTPEGSLLKTVLDGLAARRVPAWRIGVGAFRVAGRHVKMGDPGLPDVVALVPGVGALFLELKSARGRLRPEQVAFRDACRRAGAAHVVCREWADVEPWLRGRAAS